MAGRERLLAALALVGCTAAPSGISRHAITNGSDDSDDPAVVAVGERRIDCQDTLDTICSGTLIAPRVVLSAAHCFAALGPDTRYETFQGPGAVGNGGELHHVVEVMVHPDFDAQTHTADLALLLLDSPSSAPPIPLATAPLDASLVGKTIRLVGFGVSAPGHGAGTKRQGLATLTAVDADTLRYQPDPALTCDGDSGGPGLLDEGAGEQLAGVTAAGDAACASFGLDVRVDPFVAGFIQPYLDGVDQRPAPSPSIALAGLCAASCLGDGDCPAGLACGPGQRCVLGGTPAGQFGATCAAGTGDCSCVRVEAADAPDSCRCYKACGGGFPPPGGSSGCNVGKGPPSALALLLLLVITVQILNRKLFKV
jgi:V8-like Glu-specific endopeptidase